MNTEESTGVEAPISPTGAADDVTKTGHKLFGRWAEAFDSKLGGSRNAATIRRLQEDDVDCKDGEPMAVTRRCVALLPFELVVTVLVHHRSEQVARQKCREVETITGEPCSRRHYWDRLQMANHFAGGLAAMAGQLMIPAGG